MGVLEEDYGWRAMALRRAPVVIQEYDGFSDVNEYRLNKTPVWARIKGLPVVVLSLTVEWGVGM